MKKYRYEITDLQLIGMVLLVGFAVIINIFGSRHLLAYLICLVVVCAILMEKKEVKK